MADLSIEPARTLAEVVRDGWYDLNPLVAEIDEVAAALAAP